MQVLTPKGESKRQVELPDSVFGQKVTKSVLWETVRTYLANQRQGTAKVKTRAEVSGTGKKPYRQKHTGRARHGSRRSPIHVGGGVVFGPHPRDYRLDLPKKKRRQALRIALSARHAQGHVKVVEDFELAAPKTKEMAGILAALGFSGSTLLLVPEAREDVTRASRNIPGLTVMPAAQLNTYEVLRHDQVVFTEKGLERFLSLGAK